MAEQSGTELSAYIRSKEIWLQAVLDKLGWTVEGLQKVLVNKYKHVTVTLDILPAYTSYQAFLHTCRVTNLLFVQLMRTISYRKGT